MTKAWIHLVSEYVMCYICYFLLLLSASDEILRLIATASILFYFLYHSQKTKFPVDIDAIKQFVSKARSELEGVSDENLDWFQK